MPGKREVGRDRDAPSSVDLGSRGLAQLAGQRGRRHAGRPDHGARGDPLLAVAGILDRDAVLVDVHDGVAEQRRDPQVLERASSLGRELRWEAGQQPVDRLDQQHPSLARIHRAELAPQRVAGELPDLAGHLDTGRPAADHHEGEPRASPLLVRLELGGLERAQDLPAHRQRALQRLDLVRERLPLVVTEVGVVRAPGDDQGVVRDRQGSFVAGSGLESHRASFDIEVGHRAQQHPDVPVAPEDPPEREADLGRGERPGRHLVAQRLEEVEVAAVDQRHLDVCPAEVMHRL